MPCTQCTAGDSSCSCPLEQYLRPAFTAALPQLLLRAQRPQMQSEAISHPAVLQRKLAQLQPQLPPNVLSILSSSSAARQRHAVHRAAILTCHQPINAQQAIMRVKCSVARNCKARQ